VRNLLSTPVVPLTEEPEAKPVPLKNSDPPME
jgi:hypothetical protein